ncbi:MAG: efflux RND transporter periplasmic adaptor subunit [Candidatus Omnitrophica bacterium]|nr:efflux RND transporter periplasmic adaptor subunit [Candidatus Omnitrophota bacterium]
MPTVLNYAKKYWRFVLAVLVVFFVIRSCSKKSAEGEFTWEVVRKVRVEKGSVILNISATGEIKPQNRLEVRPPIAGRVEEIYVKEGNEVKKGDLLAELSSTERAAMLDAARAKGGEAMEYWKETYRPTPLIAPIDGTIIVRAVEPGQTVDDGVAVVVISDRLIVDASVNETDVGYVKIGQEAAVILDAYPERSFSGKVDHIAFEAVLEQNVNIYHVDVLPEDLDPIFRSGMTAQVTIRAAEKHDVLTLPQEAVLVCPETGRFRTGANCVASGVKKGQPVWKEIDIGLLTGSIVEVNSGLKESETVLALRKKKNEKGSGQRSFSAFGGRRRGGS